MANPDYIVRNSSASHLNSPLRSQNGRRGGDYMDGEMSPLTRRSDQGIPRNSGSPLHTPSTNGSAQSSANRPPGGNDGRWRLNGSETNANNNPEWDLTDNLSRLTFGSANDAGDNATRSSTSGNTKNNRSVVDADGRDRFGGHSRDPSDGARSSLSNAGQQAHHTHHNAHLNGRPDPGQLKVLIPGNESKERPRSFSGEQLSHADLHRLQTAGPTNGYNVSSLPSPDTAGRRQWAQSAHPNSQRSTLPPYESPSYPSISSTRTNGHAQQDIIRSPISQQSNQGHGLKVDYGVQQRQFASQSDQQYLSSPSARSNVSPPQRQRVNFQQQNNNSVSPVALSPNYEALQRNDLSTLRGLHQQQQQLAQQGGYRSPHQISPIDAAALRDANAMAMINRQIQPGFTAGYPVNPALNPLLYTNPPFYDPQQAYTPSELAAAMALQLSPQLQYSDYPLSMDNGASSVGPSMGNKKLGLYKTELCRSFEEKGTCRYANKCQFAHSQDELRGVNRHPKYKTEICRTFWRDGSCPYGKRCCFIHAEGDNASVAAMALQPQLQNSHVQQQLQQQLQHQIRQQQHSQAQLLQMHPSQVSQQHQAAPTSAATHDIMPDTNPSHNSLLSRLNIPPITPVSSNKTPVSLPSPAEDPSPGSASYSISALRPRKLRVDTSVPGDAKQNKSAFPTFANPMLAGSTEKLASPVPVTAGPDFGRHASTRIDIVGHSHRNDPGPSPSRSFQGGEFDSPDFVTPTASGFNKANVSASNHNRSGSAGNWDKVVGANGGSGTTSSAARLAYPQSAHPNTQPKQTSPWATPSRLNEKAWVN